jgi:hypothetical protein
MGDLLGSKKSDMGNQKRTILCHWGWVVTNGIKAIAQPEMVGACTSPKRVAGGHSLGCQEWGDPMRVASEDAGSQGGVIVTSHIAWE